MPRQSAALLQQFRQRAISSPPSGIKVRGHPGRCCVDRVNKPGLAKLC